MNFPLFGDFRLLCNLYIFFIIAAFLKILCDLFVSFLGRSWSMWCTNCVILLIHDERIIWKRKFFSHRCLSLIVRYQFLQVIAFEWSIAFISLYNDKLRLCSFLMDLAVKQLVFVSLVKNAFGWRLRSSCFTLFSGLSFYVLGKLRYLVDIWWKNYLKENSYIFLLVIWVLWFPMKHVFHCSMSFIVSFLGFF